MTRTPQIAPLTGMSPLGIAPTPITALDARPARVALDDAYRVALADALALIAKTGGAS